MRKILQKRAPTLDTTSNVCIIWNTSRALVLSQPLSQQPLKSLVMTSRILNLGWAISCVDTHMRNEFNLYVGINYEVHPRINVISCIEFQDEKNKLNPS